MLEVIVLMLSIIILLLIGVVYLLYKIAYDDVKLLVYIKYKTKNQEDNNRKPPKFDDQDGYF